MVSIMKHKIHQLNFFLPTRFKIMMTTLFTLGGLMGINFLVLLYTFRLNVKDVTIYAI